jgi:hypothetical protein
MRLAIATTSLAKARYTLFRCLYASTALRIAVLFSARSARRPPLTPLDASVKKLAQDIEDLYMFHGNETPIEEVEKLIAVRDSEIIAMSKKS